MDTLEVERAYEGDETRHHKTIQVSGSWKTKDQPQIQIPSTPFPSLLALNFKIYVYSYPQSRCGHLSGKKKHFCQLRTGYDLIRGPVPVIDPLSSRIQKQTPVGCVFSCFGQRECTMRFSEFEHIRCRGEPNIVRVAYSCFKCESFHYKFIEGTTKWVLNDKKFLYLTTFAPFICEFHSSALDDVLPIFLRAHLPFPLISCLICFFFPLLPVLPQCQLYLLLFYFSSHWRIHGSSVQGYQSSIGEGCEHFEPKLSLWHTTISTTRSGMRCHCTEVSTLNTIVFGQRGLQYQSQWGVSARGQDPWDEIFLCTVYSVSVCGINRDLSFIKNMANCLFAELLWSMSAWNFSILSLQDGVLRVCLFGIT